MQITKEQTITASDGKEYQVTVTYDSESGVPMDAELEVTELLKGTETYDAYVQKTAEKLDTKPEYLSYAHAFDIKLVNPTTGEHYQPTKPVAVSIELYREDVQEGDNVSVVHFPNSYAENLSEGGELASDIDGEADGVVGMYTQNDSEGEILEANVNGEAVVFEASSFSVYVVSKDQRGFIFKFMSPEHAEYTQLRQTVFDDDALVKPVAPSEFGRVFDKWVWKGMEGTDADFSDFSFTYDAAVPENTPFLDSSGKIIVPTTQRGMKEVEVTAFFTDKNHKQYHILFNDQDENIYNHITYRAGTHIDPNGSENAANKVSYVVIQKKAGQFLTFGYWTEDLYDLDTTTRRPKPFLPEDINRDISLYPYCPQAHWLYFDVNKAQAGGQSLAFVAPKTILEGEVPTSAAVPTANGYTFDGWWTRAGAGQGYQIYDANGDPIGAAPGSGWTWAFEHRLYTGGNSLDYDPTLYAHWKANDKASATVALYIQREGDKYDSTGSGNGYNYDFSEIVGVYNQLDVGGTIKLNGNTVKYVSKDDLGVKT